MIQTPGLSISTARRTISQESAVAKPIIKQPGPLARLLERLFGYDVFLSYTRKDDPDSAYANALFVKLTNERPKLRCFLDLKNLNRDQTLSDAIAAKVRASRFFVVLAGTAAGERKPVLDEARLAAHLSKRVMLIDRGINWRATKCSLKTIIDPLSTVEDNPLLPSPDVIESIRRHVGSWRVDVLRRLTILIAFALVLALTAVIFTLYQGERALTKAEAKARESAETESRVSNSQRLAAEANNQLNADSSLALALAVEAAHVAPTFEANQTLGEVLQQRHSTPTILDGYDDEITAVTSTANGNLILTGNTRGDIQSWKRNALPEKILDKPHDGKVTSICVSSDGSFGVSGGEGGIVLVWSVKEPAIRCTLASGSAPVLCIAVTTDGSHIISSADNRILKLWRSDTGAHIRDFPLDGPCSYVTFDPSGSHFAAVIGTDDSATIKVIDCSNGTTL
jgi:hypothetical protein